MTMIERLLADAGVSAGMRVVDVGCGRGDAAIAAARLVGERGEVVGVDLDAGSLDVARERAHELGLTAVSSLVGDFCAVVHERGPFDAAVGRHVLGCQRDPVAAVRRLARALRPGGVLVFQESDLTIPPTSLAALPLHRRIRGWRGLVMESEGTNVHVGFELASILAAAGLADVRVCAEAIVQTPTHHHPVAPILRVLLPAIVARGIASAEQVGIETLDERLLEERRKANVSYVDEMIVGAWARTPS
jgi:SAM-dependent methyltransferase